ncbi:protein DELAY OF GERMINATION 1-like [Rhododendron vialii]|uniref:protein DELAY OF GERMINATION 1-like n=1 Tax=Rhododendron vialii TaxID=182163 RepID=UPI0026601E17|nr:protein DELAY OF GERMINATION 1-like [Rhododendron vialii]
MAVSAKIRPSIFIRLVYALCGADFEAQLTEFLHGGGEAEEKRTSRLASAASLQEEIADQPLAGMARAASPVGESSRDSEKALDDHGKCMAELVSGADQLRLSTLRELMGILTPVQGVEYLVASKKLQLCVREIVIVGWNKSVNVTLAVRDELQDSSLTLTKTNRSG